MIRLTIQRKVFLATFALATGMAALLILITRWNLEQGFARYTAAAELARVDWMVRNAEADYAEHGSWDFVRRDARAAWQRMLRRPGGEGGERPPPPWRGGPPHDDRPPPGHWQAGNRPPGNWQSGDRQPGNWQPPPGEPARGGPAMGEPTTGGSAMGGSAMGGSAMGGSAMGEPQPARAAAPGDTLAIGPRLALLDADGTLIAGNREGMRAAAERPLHYQGEMVGRLALLPSPRSSGGQGAAFLASQTRNLLLAGAAALLLSLVAAWWLARHFLAPIRDLAVGARRIAGNRLDTRIPVRGGDELGELAADFNTMAEQLARAEEERRAWVSDTSHELRTPLAVLRAEIEALQDGIRDADAATLGRLLKQTQQLTKLVDDLRLTLEHDPAATALAGDSVDPRALLREVAAGFARRYADAGIGLDLALPAGPDWRVRGDAGRLVQVFANLFENSLRYTHRGGGLRVAAAAEGQRLLLHFDDTAPAPPAQALPRLFERFFRAEPSRSRAHGGSGLGLSICKTIVEAHAGGIAAALSELGGLCIRIELPLESSR